MSEREKPPRPGWAKHGLSLAERFWRRIYVADNGCWEWNGVHTDRGYAHLTMNRQKLYVHRVSYEMHKGPIPQGFQIDHLCRNRGCANPDHLEAVPPRVNTQRGNAPSAIAARTNRCIRGHDLTVDVYIRKDGAGRQCNECKRIRQRAAWRERRSA